MRRVLLRGTHLWIAHAALSQFTTSFEITRVTVKLAVGRRADRVLMLEDHAFERTTAGPGASRWVGREAPATADTDARATPILRATFARPPNPGCALIRRRHGGGAH